jgi:hypothetical protein
MQCAPAFNYARDAHMTTLVKDDSIPSGNQNKAVFESKDLTLDLRYVCDKNADTCTIPTVNLVTADLSAKGLLGPAVEADMQLTEGQVVTFVLRTPPVREVDGNGQQIVETNMTPLGKLTRPGDDPFLTEVRFFLYFLFGMPG